MLPFAVVAVGAIALRLLIAGYDPGWVFTDTPGYVRVAQEPLATLHFWAGDRPFTVPLFYKIIGVDLDNYRSAAVLARVGQWQALIAGACWLGLASAVAGQLSQKWLQLTSFLLLQAFGLSLHISQWDSLLLSESLATSTFVLMLGLWIFGIGAAGAFRDWSSLGKIVYWLMVVTVTVLYSFTRDTNSFFLLGCAALAYMALLLPPVRGGGLTKGLLAIGSLLIILFLVQQWTVRESGRWRFPFYGTFLQRIYGYSEARQFFIEEGMPTGEWQEDVVPRMPRRAFFERVQNDPGARSFVRWMDTQGQLVYAQYLLAHPRILLSGPLRNYAMLLSPNSIEYRGEGARTPTWLRGLTKFAYPRPSSVVFGALLAVGVLALVVTLQEGARPWWGIPLVLWLLVPPLMLLIWHGDSIEIERHAYQIGLQLRLGTWLLLFGVLDRLIARGPDDPSKVEGAN